MPLFSDGVNSAAPVPLPDERVLEMAGITLAEVTGKRRRIESGPVLKGLAAGHEARARHRDSYRHFDLEFLPSR